MGEKFARLFRATAAAIRSFLASSRAIFTAEVRSSKFKEVLWWCLPAILAALTLRAVLTWQMPWGYFQFDSMDFVKTGADLISRWKLSIPGKRSFLVPLLYSIPFLLHLPALLLIPLAQHLLGIFQILFMGTIVRLWFVRWRIMIIPATLWLAICPWILWFEHTLMSESLTLFFLLADLCLGSLWVKTRRREYFVWLLISLFLTAGTRGEARFYFLFALLLLPFVVQWQWKSLRPYLLGTFGCLAVLAVICKNNTTAPAYLFASLVDLSPDHSRFVPGFEPYIIPLRDQCRAKWLEFPADTVKVAKQVSIAARNFLKSRHPNEEAKQIGARIPSVLNRMSLEILLENPTTVLYYPILKTQMAIDSWVSGDFDIHYLQEKQTYALQAKRHYLAPLTRGLLGKSVDQPTLDEFIKTHYHPEPVAWFGKWASTWNQTMISLRTPDTNIRQERWVHDYIAGIPEGEARMPGWPLFYPVAILGIIISIIYRHPQRIPIIAWGFTMLCVWYAAQMIGNATPRYRFVYEPFLWIYVLLLLDRLSAPFSGLKKKSTQ